MFTHLDAEESICGCVDVCAVVLSVDFLRNRDYFNKI